MRMRHAIVRPLIWIAAAALLPTPGIDVVARAQTAKPAATAKPQPAAPAAPGWPRAYADQAGQLTIYEPQISEWRDQKTLTLHAAVSYTPAGAAKPLIGTIIADADTRVAVDERLVSFSTFEIRQTHFATATKEQVSAIAAAIKSHLPEHERVIELDRVLAFVDASTIRPKNVNGVKADPPVLFYSTRPAVLVNIDGNPIWSPIENNDLRFAVNTNWDLFEHPPTKTFYLRHEKVWLQATALSGPWTGAATLPPSFGKLPADENWKEVKAALPSKAVPASTLPQVFTSTAPAELILLTGEPQYSPVGGTKLLWVRNTESDVFRLGPAGAVYYLVAGRWFSAPAFTGPWTFASLNLPDDFKRIPLEHDRSRVLASVPGTTQAAEAVLLAQVPQTARVNKKELKAPAVEYQGEPKFEAIPTTTVARATNTDKDIIKVGDSYYMCFQGVWFVSKQATGPWEVASSVPGQIYEIPISSPSHSVTYVTVEDDDDDDEWMVFAAAAAYTGVMVAWGCAVWGSGYYYPPYVAYGGFYPVYYPHYPTYGYRASYNPWTGAYTRGAVAYGPYGGAGVASRYNPRTGTYSRGAAAYGPYGARGAAQAYNPRTGAYGATRQGSNVYGSWGSTAVQRGDDWATTRRTTSNITGNTTRTTRTSEGGAAVSRRGPSGGGFVAESGSGNVYAGRDGNVYRKQGDSWQQYDNGNWSGVSQQPARTQGAQREGASGATAAAQPRTPSTVDQLNRDAAARSDGATRSQAASTVRSGSAGARAGSYRPSGGARGGGRRR